MTKIKFAKIILIFILLFPFSGHALEIEEEEIHQRPRVPPVDHIFLEKESIVAFFEITDIDGYKKFIPRYLQHAGKTCMQSGSSRFL